MLWNLRTPLLLPLLSPLMIGYYAIYALTAAANGQELQDVPTDGYWYDATNMEDEDIAPNLYD